MRTILTALAAVAFVLAPLAAPAQVAPGTRLSGTIDQSLNSGSAQVGQRFTLSHVSTTSGSGAVTAGTITGHVTAVQRAGQGRPGRIDLDFDRLVTNGQSYALAARATDVKVQTKSNVGKEILGAVGGMLVGNVLGKMIFHSGAGGAVGATGGFLLAKNNRQNVTIPQNSVVTVQVVSARRQASR